MSRNSRLAGAVLGVFCLAAIARGEGPAAHEIGIGRFHFDPVRGLPPLPPELAPPLPAGIGPEANGGLFLVQFAAPIDDVRRQALVRLGAEILDYVPRDSYLVWLGTGSQVALAALPGYRAAVPWAAGLKLALGVWPRLDESGVAPLYLGVRGGSGLAATLDRLRSLGVVVLDHAPWRGQEVVLATCPDRSLAALAQDPEVISVSLRPPKQAEGEVAKRILDGSSGAGPIVAPPGYRGFLAGKGVDGSGVTVAIIDDGVDIADASDHLRGRVTSALRGAPEGGTGHGHHVAGIVAGECGHPPDGDGYLWGIGVAPAAALLNIPAINPAYTGVDQDAVRDAVTVKGSNGETAAIASCSWGAGAGGDYTMMERLWDGFVRDADDLQAGDQPLFLSFSAGNIGPGRATLTRPHAGKNLVAVGSTLSYRPALGELDWNLLALTQSRGPAADGRIKPDLVAPGEHVAAAQIGGFGCGAQAIDGEHVYCAGTSMAQPHVAGAAALFVDAWRQDHGGLRPQPALIKAALVNGARALAPRPVGPPYSTGPVPNFDEGWGMVDLEASVRPALARLEVDPSVVLGAPGQKVSLEFAVANPSFPVKVTLVWTDAPAAVGAVPALVNDLDLALSASLGGAWIGNGLRDGFSDPAIVAPDRLNNVENVFLRLPAIDLYQARVTAVNLPGDGVPGNADPTDQDYALVVSNAELPRPDGRLRLLGGALRCGGRAEFLVYDSDLGGSVMVEVGSSTETVPELVILTATTPGGHFYRGGIDLVAGAPAANGKLEVASGDTVTVAYVDADDGRGGRNVRKTVDSVVDCAPPVIRNVRLSAITDTSAWVEWDTDEPATSEARVVGGSGTVLSPDLVTAHRLQIGGLTPCGRFSYVVASADAALNRAEDPPRDFTTATREPVFAADFEGEDSGFRHWGPLEAWQWGAPLWGPSAAASGERCFGTELGGNYVKSGRSAPNGDFMLVSPRIDLQGSSGSRLRLRYWHDIATDGFTDDGAWVEVWDGASWVFVTPEGGYGGTVDASARQPPGAQQAAWAGESGGWKTADFDLARFDGRAIVVKIRLFEEDSFLAGAPGLYIDDFEVFRYGSCRRGRPALAAAAVGCGSTVASLSDADLNTDTARVERAIVRVWSASEPVPESIFLDETAPNSGVFSGSVSTLPGVPRPGDGAVSVATGDTLVVRYDDADDGSGSPGTATVSRWVDCTPPSVGALAALVASDREAAIEWETDEPATSRVDYGVSPALGFTIDDRSLTTRHRVLLRDLDACTPHVFRVSSTDLAGNATVEDDSGRLRRFHTWGPDGQVFADDFERDRGWALDGEWERDRPHGTAFATPSTMDPNAALSRAGVLGIDLSGRGVERGNYEANVARETATSPAIDCSRLGQVTLDFARWLGVERNDRALLEASGDGGASWTPLFVSSTTSDTSDRRWKPFTYDLTPFAALRPDLRLRFSLTSDGATQSMGWQVDDLVVRDPTRPPYRPCVSDLVLDSFTVDDALGNANGIADPGETVGLGLVLRNRSTSAAARGVGAGLASGRADLGAFTLAQASFSDIPPGATGATQVPLPQLRVSPAARCGATIPITIAITSLDGAATAALRLPVGMGTVVPRDYPTAPLGLAVPDDDPTGLASTLDVSDGEAIARLAVTVDLVHPDAGDLVITLTAPGGQVVTLHGLSGDGAPYPSPAAYPPRPEDGPGLLGGLVGTSPRGTWMLRVIDARAGSTGTLMGFSLRVDSLDPASQVTGAASSPLVLVRSGANLLASFGTAPGATGHVLVKSWAPSLAGAAPVAAGTSPGLVENGAMLVPGTRFYAVRGTDACGLEGP